MSFPNDFFTCHKQRFQLFRLDLPVLKLARGNAFTESATLIVPLPTY
jgi:hypothetical protein